MFTLELLNEPAKHIIKYWQEAGIDLTWFDIQTNNEITTIKCKHFKNYFTSLELNCISKLILNFQELDTSPYLLICNEYKKERCYFPDGSYDTYLNTLEHFNWPEQLERYRYSLMLKATG